MSAKKKHGLGRGFSSLIPDELLDEAFDPTSQQDEQVSDLRTVPVAQIAADPNQPRRTFDKEALEQLSYSIKEHGILQPLVVVPRSTSSDGSDKGSDTSGVRYTIVAGERRWRAAQLAGLTHVPAIVRTLSAQHQLELSLIENLQRRDLSAIETATAYLKLRDQFNMTLDMIATRMGVKSVSTVSNKLRLLKLPKKIQQAIVAGTITEGQARPLIGLPEATALQLCTNITKDGWSARTVEQYIAQLKKQPPQATPAPAAQPRTGYEQHIERLARRLDAAVNITSTSKGSGRSTIRFKDEDDLRRIEELLSKSA